MPEQIDGDRRARTKIPAFATHRRLLIFTAFVLIAVAAGVGISLAMGGNRSSRSQAPTSRSPAHAVKHVVAQVRTGIVRIEVTTCDGEEAGTGFLIGSRLIATVQHVVAGAKSITLSQDGKTMAHGTVVGADSARDLALVRTDTPMLGYEFKLAERAPRIGEHVAAIGFPLALPLTVTRGFIGRINRTISIGGLARQNLIQTDAAVNRGNSGGPLVTDNGVVVGLVDLGTTEANGLAFAVSGQVAKPLLQAWQAAPHAVAATACRPKTPPAAQVAPTRSTPSPGTDSAKVAANAVYTYWSLLQLHKYRQAFNHLTPAEQTRVRGLAGWLGYFRGDPVESVNVNVATRSVAGDTATVDLVSLETVGGTTGCRDWTGSYRLVHGRAGWLIDYADLHFKRC
jgi:serine protease Do